MKKIAVIGSGTDTKVLLRGLKEHGIIIIDNERKVNDTTEEVFYFSPTPRIEIPQYFVPNVKGYQRPYKFHK